MSELVISAQDARNLTDKIKAGTAALWELIKEAYVSRAWASLGYASWDDYCTQEFGTSRIRLPREERREVVSSMREIGMSTRAIASATGMSKDTAARALSGVANETPGSSLSASCEPVGVDGKTYRAPTRAEDILTKEELEELKPEQRPQPEPMEPFDHDTGEILEEHPIPKEDKPRAEATTKQFMAAVADLNRILDRFHKIKTSPNYRNNIDQLTQTHASDIDRAIDELVDLRNTLN